MSQEQINFRMSSEDNSRLTGVVQIKEESNEEFSKNEDNDSKEESQKDPYWKNYQEFLVNLA